MAKNRNQMTTDPPMANKESHVQDRISRAAVKQTATTT